MNNYILYVVLLTVLHDNYMFHSPYSAHYALIYFGTVFDRFIVQVWRYGGTGKTPAWSAKVGWPAT